MVYYCGLWFLYWRWVAAPTQVNAYYAPPFNQFGNVIKAYTVAIYTRINFEGAKYNLHLKMQCLKTFVFTLPCSFLFSYEFFCIWYTTVFMAITSDKNRYWPYVSTGFLFIFILHTVYANLFVSSLVYSFSSWNFETTIHCFKLATVSDYYTCSAI